MTDLLKNKVAIVSGASSGIGRAAAKLFARHGAAVVVTARRGPLLEELVHEIEGAGGRAAAVVGDAADSELAARTVELAQTRFGGLDVAFNNAGTLGALNPTPDLALEDWEQTLRVNLTGAFLAAKAQLPALRARGGGALVFTSTFVGVTVGFPGMAAYAASKAGLVGLTQVLATEWGPHGIRVNALLPGGTDTPMGRAVADTPEKREATAALHALKRLADPIEIARAALYLCSDLSSFQTGTTLRVDGGISVNRT